MTMRFDPKLKAVGASIYAHELDTFFDRFSANYDVLSLDCFDTLLWRNVGQPKDVFFKLESSVLGQHVGLTAKMRAQAEKAAREERAIKGESTEVTLRDIYSKAFPGSDKKVIDELVANELNIEQEHCYIYEPSLELLRAAKRKGLKTMIVSDIYMSCDQLRDLVMGALRKIDADCPIDHFFSSSDKGVSKSEGLIDYAAKQIKVKTNRIIHLGDNEEADVFGATKSGATGVLLRQYDSGLQEIMRNVRYATTLLETSIRSKKPYSDDWTGLWAISKAPTDAAEILAQYSLAPILISYSYWLIDEVSQLKKAGHKPKLVFMLRDGYMPARIFEIVKKEFPDLQDLKYSEIETSRFIAYACSFSSKEKIIEYLQFLYESAQAHIKVALKQLLFSAEEIKRISIQFKDSEADFKRFTKIITQSPYLNQIIERSHQYRARFLKRFETIVDPRPQETIILVDLGYAGTIQTLIQPVLEQRFSVNVCGKYLLLQDTLNKKDKAGLIAEGRHDLRSVNLLLKHIASLEQLCSSNMPSTIDFEGDGSPIYSDQVIDKQQQNRRDMIQNAAMQFANKTVQSFVRREPSDLESQTLGLLGRMLIFPSWEEVEFFSNIVHDTNMGTDCHETMIDLPRVRSELIRSGSLAVKKNIRNAIPHELKSSSVENLVFYNAANRLGLDFRADDFKVPGEKLPIAIMAKNDAARYSVDCYNTANGYRTVHIPIGPMTDSVCLFFGQNHEWIDIESCLISANLKTLFDSESKQVFPRSHTVFEGMTERAEGLYEMHSAGSFVLFVTKDIVFEKVNTFLSVTFRPIRKRN